MACCMSARRRQADQIEGLPTAISKGTVPSQTYKCAAPFLTRSGANVSRAALLLRREWSDALGLCRARSKPSSHASPAHAVPAGRALSDDRSAPSALAFSALAALPRLATGMCRLRGAPRRYAALPAALGDADRLPPRAGRTERALDDAGQRGTATPNRLDIAL